MKKLCKLYTKPYILPVAILIFSALCCVGFAFRKPTQTIHKPYTELYIESQRVKESKSQRDKETKRQRVEEREGGA